MSRTGVVVTGADLAPDGEHLLLEVSIAGKTQIAVSNLDGGEYQCISCGLVTNAAKAVALEDNQRIWFASTSGQQSADDPLGGRGFDRLLDSPVRGVDLCVREPPHRQERGVPPLGSWADGHDDPESGGQARPVR